MSGWLSIPTYLPERARLAWLALADALEGWEPSCTLEPEVWWEKDLTAVAVAACWRCSAREQCLAFALALPEREGVWGGLLPGERAVRGVAS